MFLRPLKIKKDSQAVVAYSIDSCLYDEERQIFKILGWIIPTLNESFVVQVDTEYSVKRIVRKDAIERYSRDYHYPKCGFEITLNHISKEDTPTFTILQDQNQIFSCTVDVSGILKKQALKTKLKNIVSFLSEKKISIEHMEYRVEKYRFESQDKSLLITGWAMKDGLPVKVTAEKSYEVNTYEREDLKAHYEDDYQEDQEYGFELLVHDISATDQILFSFEDANRKLVNFRLNMLKYWFFYPFHAIRLHYFKALTTRSNLRKIVSFCVERYHYEPSEKELHISGWLLPKSDEIIEITTDKEYTIKKIVRDDVFTHFTQKYDFARECGFEMVLKNVSRFERPVVIFGHGKTKYLVCRFNLVAHFIKKILRNIFIMLKAAKPKNFVKFVRHLQKFGLTKTIDKVKFKLVNASDYDANMSYQHWIINNEKEVTPDEVESLSYQPLISILMPTYNVERKWLTKCIDSVINQVYQNWELCIADDCSTNPEVKETLTEFQEKDKRIKVVYRKENGHISKATNSALEIATGEYVALLDNDDEFPKNALYEIAKLVNEHPEADLIYSDEDKISEKGQRFEPHFKAGWSPDTFLSANYVSHLGVYRKSIVDEVGGFRAGLEGSQDYDLALRVAEKTKHIFHIPKILYHWRAIPGSTAVSVSEKNYAFVAGFKALEDAVKRRGYHAVVEEVDNIPHYFVKHLPTDEDFVSIIIPTKDKANILETCLKTVYEKTAFRNFEIIVVDNGSVENKTLHLFEKYKKYDNFRVLRLEIPFNFSKLNNEAVKLAKGNLILLLNNDIEVISPDWLEIMVGQARRPEIGAVGAKLLYPNKIVQHGGIVMGLGGVAGHAGHFDSYLSNGYYARLKINYNYSAVTAACLMVKKSIYEEVGGFTEELTVAYNDVDFCLKILEKGYYNVMVPRVQLYHHESLSRGKDISAEKKARTEKEIAYINEHWEKYIKDDPFYSPNLSLNSGFLIKDGQVSYSN